MRKQNKIVSLILVLALLLGVFVALPATKVAAADDFTPTATEEELAYNAEYVATPAIIDTTVDGNLYATQNGGSKLSDANNLKMYEVTESNGNTYLKLVPTTTGATSGNSYFSTESLQYLDGTPTALTTGFIVYDFDIATESEVIGAMKIQPVFDTGSGSYYPSTRTLTEIVGNKDYHGNYTWDNLSWNHITLVMNLSSNEYRIYRASERVAVGYLNDAVGAGYTFKGVRFDLDEGASVSADQSVLLDNISCRVYDAADNGVWASSGYIYNWAGDVNQTREPAKLPAVATINGVTVYKAAELKTALEDTAAKQNVEILRDISTAITVNTFATVETHGLNVNLTAGVGVDLETTGTVMNFTKGWMSSVGEQELDHGDASTPDMIIDSTMDGNVYIGQDGFKLQGDDAENLTMYKVTDNETGNTYLKITPTATGTTVGTPSFTTALFEHGDDTTTLTAGEGNGAFVYEFDIATDSELLSSMIIKPYFAGGKYITNDYSGIRLADLASNMDSTTDEWVHVTIFCRMDNRQVTVYLGTERAITDIYFGTTYGGSSYRFAGCLFELPEGSAISEDESLLIDNVSLRIFKTDAETGTGLLESAWTISDWDKRYTAEADKLPSIATVNGVKYRNVFSLADAIKGGKTNLTVSLDRVPTGVQVEMESTGTIVTNGLDNFITAGGIYVLTDNGDGTYTVSIDDKDGKVIVNINGDKLIEATLPLGTDLAEYLKANNAYLANAQVIASDSGKVYKNATWDVTPTTLGAEEVVFNVTATEATEDVLFFTPAGATATGKTVESALSDYGDYDMVFNADYTLTSTGFYLRGNKNVYLAGHTLSFPESEAYHRFLVPGEAGNITFIGGRIEDKVNTDTYSIFYFNNNPPDGEVKLVNTEVFTVARIAAISNGGTITLENSSINVLEHYRGSAFEIDEGSAANKCVVNLINSTVRYNHSLTGNARSFVNINGTAVAHELNISGCDISMDFTSALITATNPAAKITIDNTQLNVMNLLSTDTTTPVVFGENVVSAVSLTGVGTFDEGVVEVKSGVPGLPYAYTAEYATVNWSNGEQDKWAAGTYPVNPFCQTDGITKVEAGQTYTFEAEDVELGLKANVTLNTNLVFNLYIPTTCEINSVVIGGVEYSVVNAPIVSANYVECYHFEYELAPYRAAAHFSMVVTLANGTTVGRDISFVEYADRVLEAYASDTKATNLVKAILNYIAVAQESMGVYNDGYEATRDFEDPAATEVTGEVNNVGALSSYITSAALDLSAAPKWVFTLAESVTGEDITFSVGGTEYAAVVVGNTLVLELPAYDMLDTITITAGEAEGEYNFAAYYASLKTLADGFTPDWNNRAAGNNAGAEATFYLNLLDAFYTYAQASAAYKG